MSRHFRPKTRTLFPLMLLGNWGWGIPKKGRTQRVRKHYVYIMPLAVRLAEVCQLQKFILNYTGFEAEYSWWYFLSQPLNLT